MNKALAVFQADQQAKEHQVRLSKHSYELAERYRTKNQELKPIVHQEWIEQAKLDQETKELQQCTFHPKTISIKPANQPAHQTASERLYQMRLNYEQKAEADKKKYEEVSLEPECTFKPKINTHHRDFSAVVSEDSTFV